jgi:hypothetical protein
MAERREESQLREALSQISAVSKSRETKGAIIVKLRLSRRSYNAVLCAMKAIKQLRSYS